MKQLLQNLKDGATELIDCPTPKIKPGHLLIATRASVISVGTEKMLVEFGRSSYLARARKQPEKVKQVLEKIKTEGLLTTAEAVNRKLNTLLPLGYCNTGVVLEVGDGVGGFSVGDRVASNGYHAEVVLVPKHLCVKIPDNVEDKEAAFTVMAAIALQGVRLLQPTLGERFVVYGVGIIGLLTIQILIANGCKVLALDFNESRLRLAEKFGAAVYNLTGEENPLPAAERFTEGLGVDGVVITTATTSDKPVEQAAKMCRKRGRIVLVGVTGLHLNRSDFYEKELTFQVSCSYGPGRYDPDYEVKGHDYPPGFVRWTEQRNMMAIMDLLSQGSLDVKSLITHRYPFSEAGKAYQLIMSDEEPYLGIVLKYPSVDSRPINNRVLLGEQKRREEVSETDLSATAVVGMVGAGDFAGQVLLPAVKKTGAVCKTIAAGSGVNAAVLGRQHGFQEAVSDSDLVFNDQQINTVMITTRHDSHAGLTVKALNAGKHVFVEKPLCLTLDELALITRAYSHSAELNGKQGIKPPVLMVGFNRRFSPFITKIKALTGKMQEPLSMVMTVNAGKIPAEHWTQDRAIGGGRIIGEACHFVDLLRYVAGSPVVRFKVVAMKQAGSAPLDSLSIAFEFENGSIGTVNYLSNGHKSYPKEKLEVFCGGRVLVLDNFRKLTGHGWPLFKTMKSFKQQKGHLEEVAAFIKAVEARGPAPIPFEEIEEITRLSILIDQRVTGQSAGTGSL